MRRAAALSLLVAGGLSLGCPRNAPEIPATTASVSLSRVEAADPQAADQLIEGFYPLEQGLWRWTKRKFVVSLAPPQPVPNLPVQLDLRFTIPDVIIDTLGPVTLTAQVDSIEVGSHVYEEPGVGLTFTAEVPDGVAVSKEAVVAFELDKSLIADEEPKRELGIVFLSAALQ